MVILGFLNRKDISMRKFAVIGDSTCDVTPELRKQFDIDYCRMMVSWVDKEKKEHEVYASLEWDQGISHKEYFDMLADGTRVITSQVSEPEFDLVFRKHLQAGEDILYIACSSALSASGNLALRLASDKYNKEFPDAKIVVVDSLISCIGQGSLLIKASQLREEGKSLEETAAYIEEHKLEYHQVATVENLNTLKRAGRVKASAAFFGNLFGVKPILISDAKGNNYAIEKQKGRRNALLRCAEMVKNEVVDAKNQILYISDAECRSEDIELLLTSIKANVPFKDVVIVPMGPIIGGTTGKGTVGIFFVGEKVTIIGE